MARNPILVEYGQAADGVRRGDRSPSALSRLAQAEAARNELQDKALAASAPSKPGWWNLPVAASCWGADAKHVERH